MIPYKFENCKKSIEIQSRWNKFLKEQKKLDYKETMNYLHDYMNNKENVKKAKAELESIDRQLRIKGNRCGMTHAENMSYDTKELVFENRDYSIANLNHNIE